MLLNLDLKFFFFGDLNSLEFKMATTRSEQGVNNDQKESNQLYGMFYNERTERIVKCEGPLPYGFSLIYGEGESGYPSGQ